MYCYKRTVWFNSNEPLKVEGKSKYMYIHALISFIKEEKLKKEVEGEGQARPKIKS